MFSPFNKLVGRGRVAPDFFLPSWSDERSVAESRVDEGEIVISFLAEIHPRKGLDEFVRDLDA